jgi:hypothetical protein
MRNTSIIFFGLLALSLSSCTSDFFNKTIELDNTDYDKQMVIHAFLSQEDTMLLVSVTQNFGLTETVKDEDYYLPGAALAWIDGSGVTTTDFSHANRDQHWKLSLPTLVSGQTYTLKASAGTLSPVEVQQVMPTPIQIDTIIYIEDGGISQFGDDLSRVEVIFQDPAGQKNFYAMTVQRTYFYEQPIFDPNTGQILGYDTLSYTNTTYAEEPVDPAAESGIDNEIIFSDDLFEGNQYRLRYSFANYNSGDQGKITVRFRHITEDEYLYRITESKRQASEDFPLVEPVIVHSNVKNGIGIFGLSWSKTVIIE